MGPSRKLTDLAPRYADNVLAFDCPCNRCKDIRENPEAERNKLWCDARIRIPILPREKGWTHTGGESLDDLSLQPSILIGHPDKNKLGGCEGWHGYLTDGVLAACE